MSVFSSVGLFLLTCVVPVFLFSSPSAPCCCSPHPVTECWRHARSLIPVHRHRGTNLYGNIESKKQSQHWFQCGVVLIFFLKLQCKNTLERSEGASKYHNFLFLCVYLLFLKCRKQKTKPAFILMLPVVRFLSLSGKFLWVRLTV